MFVFVFWDNLKGLFHVHQKTIEGFFRFIRNYWINLKYKYHTMNTNNNRDLSERNMFPLWGFHRRWIHERLVMINKKHVDKLLEGIRVLVKSSFYTALLSKVSLSLTFSHASELAAPVIWMKHLRPAPGHFNIWSIGSNRQLCDYSSTRPFNCSKATRVVQENKWTVSHQKEEADVY